MKAFLRSDPKHLDMNAANQMLPFGNVAIDLIRRAYWRPFSRLAEPVLRSFVFVNPQSSAEDATRRRMETKERHNDYKTSHPRRLCRNRFGRWCRTRRSLQHGRQGRRLWPHARLHRSNDDWHWFSKNRSAPADRNDEPRGRRKSH